jgi:hypothetical protein
MSEPSPHSQQHSTGRRKRRYLLLVPAIVLLILAAGVAAAPALLSTGWGRDAALGWINRGIPGEIRAGAVSLSWLGGQSISGLEIRDPGGQPVVTLASLNTELSLLDALRQRLSMGQTVIRGLDADLRFDAGGTSNLTAALGGGSTATEADAGGVIVPVTGNMALIESRLAIAAPGIDPVVLDNLSGALEMTGMDAPLKLSFGGSSRQGDLQGSITVNGQVSNLFSAGRLDPANARADIRGGIEDLPVDALDQLLGLNGALAAALGDRATLNVAASGDAARQDITIDARAPRAELALSGSIADGAFSLSEPASARLALSPALVDALLRTDGGEPAFRLAESVPLRLTVERLSLPLEAFDPSTVALKAGLDAGGGLRLTGLPEVGDVSISDLRMVIDSPGLGDRLRLTLNGKPVTRGESGTLSVDADIRQLLGDNGALQWKSAVVRAESRIAGIPTTLLDALLQQDGLLPTALGPTLDLNLDADTDDKRRIAVTAQINAAQLSTGPIRVSVDDRITLLEPARIQLTLAPALWPRLAGEGSTMAMTEPAVWTLNLRTFAMPVPAGEAPVLLPGSTALHGTLATPVIALRNTGDASTVNIRDLSLDIAADTLETIVLQASAAIEQPGGTLAALDARPFQVVIDGQTGLKADATVKAISSTLTLESPGLKGKLNTTVEEGFKRLLLDEPAVFEATLTSALLASTSADPASPRLSLRRPASLRATVNKLTVPLAPFDTAGIRASGGLKLDSLALESTDGASSTVDNTEATFDFTGEQGGRATLDVSGRVISGADQPGDLSLALSAGNLLSAQGGFNIDALSLDLDGRLQHLPSALLDRMLAMEGLISATLGPAADLAINAKLDKRQGPVSLKLDADNTRADIQARIGENGMTLTDPLTAQFEPTPEFGKQVLSKIHPLFETTQRAEQPIRFEVPPEGVLVPLDDFDFSRITVPSMTLDFGRIVLKSGWLLRGIVGLGQQFGRMEGVEREEWVAWFTPGILSIRDGRILYERRLDVLLDERLHLATWGTADVAADRSDLTLAFMPDTMERVFSITVSENDALHVPIKGPLSSPGVDFKKTAADLARLRAQEEVSGENPLAGLLLGSVGGKVTGAGPVPPASVSPLPWAEMLRERDAARQQAETQQAPATDTQQTDQAAPEKKPSTEEQVIKGLIDIFGNKKKQ